MKLSKKLAAIAGASVILIGGGVTATYASIPDSKTKTITACVSKFTAVARVIDYQAGKRCRKTEKMVRWNAAGVKGATGPRGYTGATGAQGPAGTAGAVGPQGPKGDTGATGAQGAQGAVGATGPKGDTGATGAQGATGAAGASGVSGYVAGTFGAEVTTTDGTAKVATATCPAGKVALGGGFKQTLGDDVSINVMQSYASSANTWAVAFSRMHTENVALKAQVICASVS